MNARSIVLLLVASALYGCPAPESHPYPVRDCRREIVYRPAESIAGGVQIAGEWSAFAPEPMERREDGTYRTTVELAPRDYGYRFVHAESGQRVLDPENPYTRWVANEEHSRLEIGDCREPELRLETFLRSGETSVEVVAQYVDGSEKASVDPSATTLTLDGVAVEGAFDEQTGRLSFKREDLSPGKHVLVARSSDSTGRAAQELYLPFWVEPEPFDWQEAILYFAFTDRFRNGDPANDAPTDGVELAANYQGGDFAGIRQAIEEGYFDQLGVRAIWISPVQANPDGAFPGSHNRTYTGYHGYWPSAARETQPRFGSIDELKALTKAAHDRGIRVITDLVINHVHQQHPYFAEHQTDGWFNVANSCVCGVNGCDWEQRRLDCWFTAYLPDLNWRSTQLTDQMIEDALFWLKEADLDGFRLDAVKHLDHVAGRTLAGRLNEISARTGIDYYLVGETFTGSDGRPLIAEYISPDELDGQFDFPLYWPIVDAFARGGSLKGVDDAVIANEAFYAPGILNSPFAGNHDVPRFISIAAGQVEADSGAQAWGNKPPPVVTAEEPFRRTRDALTFVLTQPGVPLVYYGDEVGLPGTGDPDNRRFMKWGAQLSAHEAALLEHVKKVGSARRANRALRYGARYTLIAEADALVYQRDDATSGSGALVVIHRGSQERTFSLDLRGRLKSAAGATLTDVISGRSASVANGRVTITAPARSAGVWTTP